MRILHVYKDYYPVLGGIENHIRLLAESQARYGDDVTVLVTGDSWRTQVEDRNGVTIVKAGRLIETASTPLSARLSWYLYGQRPDITHLHFPYPPGEVSQWPLLRRRATVLTYHSDVVRQQRLLRYYRPAMLRILKRIDRIIVTSPSYLASSEVLRLVADRCKVVPLGIDQTPFRQVPPEAVADLERRYGDGPWVLFVGVLRYYKGLRYLIEAMQQIPARLLIVGQGPEEPRLREQVAQLGLQDKVIFAGAVSDADLPAYYRLARLFCLPASERSEAFGLVQVEALASGLPIVCTELGTGTSYVNKDGVSGLVVAPRDASVLTAAILRLLNDDALRQRLADGALQRAQLFTATKMLTEMRAVYEDVLDQRRHHEGRRRAR